MKKLLLLITMFSCTVQCLSQRGNIEERTEHREILIKKQVIGYDLENRVKDIPFAAVRTLARQKIAGWLWSDGNDELGRAEQIAVRAVDDLYENKDEIPSFYFSSIGPELFILLDRFARDEADRLRKKYRIRQEDQAGLFDSLLSQQEGDKMAVDAAIKSLGNQSEANFELSMLIWRLQNQNSPELHRLLIAIIYAEETGRARFSANTLISMSGSFVETNIPLHLQKRFLKVIVDRSRHGAQMPEGDAEGYFRLLSGLMADISIKLPELLPEASIIQTVLKTKVSRESSEAQERNDRIKNSSDRLSALISEAEKVNDGALKYDLYIGAVHLALKLKKFVYSVDLVERSAEIDLSSNPIPESFREKWRDQFRGQVVTSALEAGDPSSANYAIKKMTDSLAKADNLRKAANYYLDRNDLTAGRTAFDESVRYATGVESSPRSISILIKMLPTAQKIDPGRVFELNKLVAKSINAIPSLDPEDKPETENYKNYVTKVMAINWNLLPALTELVRVNKNAATDLANRIDKKEIKIIANYVLLTDSIVQSTDAQKDQESALSLR